MKGGRITALTGTVTLRIQLLDYQTSGWVAYDDVRLVGPQQVTKYYSLGGQRIAMRQGGALTYLHGDHLGSASLATSASGQVVARQGYYPYGATRYATGAMPTDRTYTGQQILPTTGGLMYYGARFYSPYLNRFISADTIVPNPLTPQLFNRYSYARNNPLGYVDPSGHNGVPWWVKAAVAVGVVVVAAVAVDLAFIPEGRIAVNRNAGEIRRAANQYDLPHIMVAAGIASQGDAPTRPFGLDVVERAQIFIGDQFEFREGTRLYDRFEEPSVGIGQITPGEALSFGENPENLFDPAVSIRCMAHKISGVDDAIRRVEMHKGITVSE